jgi:hypothetical protein
MSQGDGTPRADSASHLHLRSVNSIAGHHSTVFLPDLEPPLRAAYFLGAFENKRVLRPKFADAAPQPRKKATSVLGQLLVLRPDDIVG